MSKKIPLRTVYYQWESLLYRKPELLEPKQFSSGKFSPRIEERDAKGKAIKITLRCYAPSQQEDLYLVGEWNNWGEKLSVADKFQEEYNGWWSITTTNIRHKTEYLFFQKKEKKYLRNPASPLFSEDGNSIFWDFEDPSTYKQKYAAPNTLHRPTITLQTDLPGLVSHWHKIKKDIHPFDKTKEDLFTYITRCGVLDYVKELGFNTLQFLPLHQSIDGDNWKFRYLVVYPFALQKNWGTPDTFSKLIDECHKRDIAIMCDLVISHCPHKDFSLFARKGEEVGLGAWEEKDGKKVFLKEYTPWGTMRFDYDNPHIREYLIESALLFLEEYKIDGYRIDNIDGILRYGDHGQGDDRPNGRRFLRELHSAIYEYKPMALIHLESHYFFGDNAKMLVAPLTSDPRALGATAYNSSRLTYYFHKEFMPKTVEEISIWKFEHIREEKEWGKSNSTIADFHNHDAAAGLMEGRATGSYAYDCLILNKPELHQHAVGKIKAMEAIIAFGCEGRILDLAQTFLLQLGTFEHDSSIHWNLLSQEESKNTLMYKQAVNHLLQTNPAFWPENTLYRQYVNIDEVTKVLIIKRIDKTQGTNDEFWCVINTSNKYVSEYAIGIPKPFKGKIVLSTEGKNQTLHAQKSSRFEMYPFEWISDLRPYEVVVIKKQ